MQAGARIGCKSLRARQRVSVRHTQAQAAAREFVDSCNSYGTNSEVDLLWRLRPVELERVNDFLRRLQSSQFQRVADEFKPKFMAEFRGGRITIEYEADNTPSSLE